MNRASIAIACLIIVFVALLQPLPAIAQSETKVHVTCQQPWQFKGDKCAPPENEQCWEDAGLKKEADGKCVSAAENGQTPAPICMVDGKAAPSFEYSKTEKKCVVKPSALANCGAGTKFDEAKQVCLPDVNSFFANWGLGLAYVKFRENFVNDAAIIPDGAGNNTVRALTKERSHAQLVFVRHFYPDVSLCIKWGKSGTVTCPGGYVAVGLGSANVSSKLIDMSGAGIVLGFGAKGNSNDLPFNVGYGLARVYNVRMLGDGFSENGSPPPGETQVRYINRDVNAQMLFFTYKWD